MLYNAGYNLDSHGYLWWPGFGDFATIPFETTRTILVSAVLDPAGEDHDADADVVDGVPDVVSVPKEQKPVEKQNPGELEQNDVEKSTWNYSTIRMEWIKKHRKENACTFAGARALWDQSSTKKAFLSKVSVAELRRRKFIPKGSKLNPWNSDSDSKTGSEDSEE